MLKREELSNPDSCLNRAADSEMLFVLLARDVAAPATVRFWVSERLRLGKNISTDGTIVNALRVAEEMDAAICESKNRPDRDEFDAR